MRDSISKPPILLVTLLAMCAFNLTVYLFVYWGTERVKTEAVLDTLFILFGYFVLFFCWQGRNWTRVLVILTSILSVFNLFLLSRPHSFLQKAPIIGEAILGIYPICWLNTCEAKGFFQPAAHTGG